TIIYRRGDYFRPHVDNTGHPLQPEPAQRRKVSILVFLNGGAGGSKSTSTSAGGSLQLFRFGTLEGPGTESWDLEPRRGLLIAYRSSQWSEIRAVRSGRAHVLMAWMLGRTLVSPPGEAKLPEWSLADSERGLAVVDRK